MERAEIEAAAVDGYRSGRLGLIQVQRMLGLESRWDTEEFLHRMGAYLDYTLEDLEKDVSTLRAASGR